MKTLIVALVTFAAFISIVFQKAFKHGEVKAEHENKEKVLDEIQEADKIADRVDSDSDFNERVQDRFSR